MGAYRDAQTFALDDARNYGVQSGRKTILSSLGSDLGIDPEVIDGLGSEQNLVSRVERLEVIAASVAELLRDSIEKLDVLQLGDAEQVAGFIIADQLPPLDSSSLYVYTGSHTVYQLELKDDGEVDVLTDVWGGPMSGPHTFGERFSLSAEWLKERLLSRGVEKDEEFCEQVVSEVTVQMTNQGDQVG